MVVMESDSQHDIGGTFSSLHMPNVVRIWQKLAHLHYESKLPKLPTDILYVFTKFLFRIFHHGFVCKKSAKY